MGSNSDLGSRLEEVDDRVLADGCRVLARLLAVGAIAEARGVAGELELELQSRRPVTHMPERATFWLLHAEALLRRERHCGNGSAPRRDAPDRPEVRVDTQVRPRLDALRVLAANGKLGQLQQLRLAWLDVLQAERRRDHGELLRIAEQTLGAGGPAVAGRLSSGAAKTISELHCAIHGAAARAALEIAGGRVAERWLQQFLRAAAMTNDAAGEADAIALLGCLRARQRRCDEALSLLTGALRRQIEMGRRAECVAIHQFLGQAWRQRGALTEAVVAFGAARRLARSLGDLAGVCDSALAEAQALIELRNLGTARQRLHEVRRLARGCRWTETLACSYAGLAGVHIRAGRLPRARTALSRAQRLRDALDCAPRPAPELVARWAEYRFASGEIDEALRLLAQQLAAAAGDVWRGEALRLQGEIFLVTGRRALAVEALRAAHLQLQTDADRSRVAVCELALAKCHSREATGMAAGQKLRQSATRFLEAAGVPTAELDLLRLDPVEFPTKARVVNVRPGGGAARRRVRSPLEQWAAHGVITRSPALHRALLHAARIAASRIPVLIQGETGSGKEVLARAVHRMSGRAGSFVVFNAATCQNELFEAELFGHRKGAFTGAHRDREGVIAQAAGGTLLLDEIGDLGAAAQASLLRFLDRGEIRPVGADRVRHVDARIVTATHLPLQQRVAAERFRRDLYFRLAGVEIELPPLRARPEDILPLVYHFARRHSADLERIEQLLAAGLAERLLAYTWPGNVRQLAHWVDQLVALLQGDPDSRIVLRLLERALRELPADRRRGSRPSRGAESLPMPSREELIRLLRLHRGNISALAADLQTYRTHVYRLLQRRGIDHRRYRTKRTDDNGGDATSRRPCRR